MSNGTMSPHVNPKEFDTELAAVWYAASYYYKESYVRGGETTGVLFKKPNGKYGFTVRMDGGFHTSRIRWSDVPNKQRCEITAAWHTHVPGTRACQIHGAGAAIACLLFSLTDGMLQEFRSFSREDRGVADWASDQTGRDISFYLITADMIKRYRPGKPDKMWKKDIPSRMGGIWQESF
jgi:hypothetical protein